MRFPLRIEFPIVATFEEVDLAVAAPNKRSINAGRNPRESFGDRPRVASARYHVLELPVLIALEEVGRLGFCPSEASVQVARQSRPVLSDFPWVTRGHTVRGQLPVAVTSEDVRVAVPSFHDGIDVWVAADVVGSIVCGGGKASRACRRGDGWGNRRLPWWRFVHFLAVQRLNSTDVVFV